ncbi:asparagine synthase (glutamine-hydrolyzing) [Shewanella frigidimarina]|uniref:asparagine synthase (glutamine-hydrolyzing) n=1 Tax=Shewanella frigidimarina TaxID=56812 RepID=UPI003D79B442
MCGLLGSFWVKPPSDREAVFSTALAMQKHRGPDDKGIKSFTIGESAYLSLGHARLSIIDLSANGHQPMRSQCSKFEIVFNGEIYNYLELKDELVNLGYIFESESDTEVLLNAWIEWGEAVLPRLEGMYSFCIFDLVQESVTLIRDPFGIKPLFVHHSNSQLIFSSELSSVLALMTKDFKIDHQTAFNYLNHGFYDNTESTFIADITHVQPAHITKYCLKTNSCIKNARWWFPCIEEKKWTFEEAKTALRAAFLDSIKKHLRSDVPIGCALSGGVDSSAIVCSIRFLYPELPINTFSYIAQDESISEECWVDVVNEHVSAKSHKVYADHADLSSSINELVEVQGEPFGGTSIFVQKKVYEAARSAGVKVTLDGQGADELLGGYSGYPGQIIHSLIDKGRFISALSFLVKWKSWPNRSLKEGLLSTIWSFMPHSWFEYYQKITGKAESPVWLDAKVLHNENVDVFRRKAQYVSPVKGRRLMTRLANGLTVSGLQSLLRHGDRNSMSASIESRVPFLTIPLVELVLSFPEEFLVSKHGATKHIFKEAMRGIVPDEILDRKDKVGFTTPEYSWMQSLRTEITEQIVNNEAPDFVKKDLLIKEIDAVLDGKKTFGWHVWRKVNYMRWYSSLYKVRTGSNV